MAAHELGHYLFDCIGNPGRPDVRRVSAENYPRSSHSSEKGTRDVRDARADRSAAALLMPADRFRERYHAAARYGGSRIYIIRYPAWYFQVKEPSATKRIYEVLYGGGY